MAMKAMNRFSRTDGLTLTELVVTLVVTLVVAGIITQTAVQATRTYGQQQTYIDARKSVGASLDMMVRMARQATNINPDPAGTGIMNSIRLKADWNPRNGVLTDPWEDVTFSVANGQLMKKEPTDAAAVPFADNVQSLSIAYYNNSNVALSTPPPPSKIAYIVFTITSTSPIQGGQPIAISSAAAVREIQ
jgi:Tfp pilus assembly protein PilW